MKKAIVLGIYRVCHLREAQHSIRRMRSQFRHETEKRGLGPPQQAANFNFVMKFAQLASIFCGFRHRIKFETAASAFCHTS